MTTLSSPLSKPLRLRVQRLFLWPSLLSLIFLSACSAFQAQALNYDIQPREYDQSTQNIRNISGFLLRQKNQNKLPIVELSDLAWDQDEQLLYAISDEGLFYKIKLRVNKDRIKHLHVMSATQLLNKKQQPLKGKFSDAEGLDLVNGNNGIKGDTQLIISFENKPRIVKYNTDGTFIKKIKIAKKLRKRRFFRHKNKALESVVNHPKYGILTAAEQPLLENTKQKQSVYNIHGKAWHFAASTVKNSSITALEVLANGDLLILERAYNGILSPVIITLRQLSLDDCNKERYCQTKTLATLDSSSGWLVDNFEGLTQIANNKYLMVSDNNKNPLQKTIFVLFDIPSQ